MKLVSALLLFPIQALAISLGYSESYVPDYCGGYASVIKTGAQYEIFSNAVYDLVNPCPGPACPGLVRYTGPILGSKTHQVVAPNSIINDATYADGKLSTDRLFSRPVVAKDGSGYVAVATALNSYPPKLGKNGPAFLTSQDGIHWTYKGQFKGEAANYSLMSSGMALEVNNSTPRYRYYTDGYGVKLAGLWSDDGVNWKFYRNAAGGIKEMAPPEWKGALFASMVKFNGFYYMTAGDKWPPQAWQFAKSVDGVNWKYDGIHYTSGKGLNFYIDDGRLKALGGFGFKKSCGFKIIYPVVTNTRRVNRKNELFRHH